MSPDLFVPVFGDRGKLRQVFINVIDNALKYSDPGDTTTVSARVEGNSIVIEVEDTGCGISAADLPKIKTKFYKANLTRRGSRHRPWLWQMRSSRCMAAGWMSARWRARAPR